MIKLLKLIKLLSFNKYLKTSPLIVVDLFLFGNISSQNLILNSSFENYSNINCGSGGFDNYAMFPVPHIVDNWYTLNSPDYFNVVCGAGGYSVPYSWFGNNYAKEGNAFAGIGVYDIRNNYKEYAYQQLNTLLQTGKTYCLSFYVSRADRFPFAIKNIGAFFSNSLPSLIGGEYINAIPQVLNQNGFISDTTNWVQIQGCFVAMGTINNVNGLAISNETIALTNGLGKFNVKAPGGVYMVTITNNQTNERVIKKLVIQK